VQVLDLIFSDYASAHENGKFTLVGAGFSNINATELPYVHPLMFILVRLRITVTDSGKHFVEVRIVGEKGTIFKAGYDVNVGKNEAEQHLPIAIPVQSLRFEYAGEYNCELLIDGETRVNHALRVRPGLK